MSFTSSTILISVVFTPFLKAIASHISTDAILLRPTVDENVARIWHCIALVRVIGLLSWCTRLGEDISSIAKVVNAIRKLRTGISVDWNCDSVSGVRVKCCCKSSS